MAMGFCSRVRRDRHQLRHLVLLAYCVPGLLSACQQPADHGAECIAPANPGGGWDLTCRTVARVLRQLDLVPGTVRVTNMPGAGGGVAFVHTVTQRRDDAHLIVAASPSTTLNLAQGFYGSLTEDDVRWLAAVGTEYGAIAVRADAPWLDLVTLVDAWRRDPSGVIVSGGSAVGSQDHMKILLLAKRAGMDHRGIRYVPFDGGGEALSALLGGFVHLFSGDASEMVPHLEAGNIRVIAVFAPERLGGILSQVPTALESGFDVVWTTWRGFYLPGHVADEVYEAWVVRLTRLAESAAWDRVRQQSRLEPWFLAGEPFERFVRIEIGDLRELSRDIGIIE